MTQSVAIVQGTNGTIGLQLNSCIRGEDPAFSTLGHIVVSRWAKTQRYYYRLYQYPLLVQRCNMLAPACKPGFVNWLAVPAVWNAMHELKRAELFVWIDSDVFVNFPWLSLAEFFERLNMPTYPW